MTRQTSNIPRSLALLRKMKFIPEKSEHRMPSFSVKDDRGGWKQLPGKRRDLFGIADITALHPELIGTTYVQVCSAADLAKHFTDAVGKFLKLGKDDWVAPLPTLLKTGNRFWLLEWARRRRPIKTCTKCKGQDSLLGASCTKCKGEGYTGGGVLWAVRIWETYLDERDDIQRRTLWSSTLRPVRDLRKEIKSPCGDIRWEDARPGGLHGVFRGHHSSHDEGANEPQATRG